MFVVFVGNSEYSKVRINKRYTRKGRQPRCSCGLRQKNFSAPQYGRRYAAIRLLTQFEVRKVSLANLLCYVDVLPTAKEPLYLPP